MQVLIYILYLLSFFLFRTQIRTTMKHLKLFTFALTMLLAGGATLAQAQTPTDNPFTARYSAYSSTQHWTDSINWSNTVNIQAYANLTTTEIVDDLIEGPGKVLQCWDSAYHAAVAALQATGGGVIYFPALPQRNVGVDSSYYFCKIFFKIQYRIAWRNTCHS